MINKFEGLPEFVVNISSNLLMKINKFGSVLFINDKAKCVFNKIDINKSLKFCVQADDWAVLNKNIEIALYNQYSHHFYWEYQGRFYIVYVYPEDNFLWLCFEDITEKQHLSHLLHINSLRRLMSEKFSKSGYWELDLTNKQFYWSSGVYKLFEIDEKNSNSCRKNLIRELILPQDIYLYKTGLKTLLKDKKDISGFIRILTSQKQIKKCRFGAGVFYENGEEKIAGVFVDVSDCERQNCEKCRFLSENFSCLFAKTVHDLRQPISALRLIIENIKENMSGEVDIQITKMENVCNNLTFMINGMSNFVKDEKIVAEKFNLQDVIKKVCDEYYDKFEKKGIKLILKLKNYEIYQNFFLVEKIIRNLVDNALKFSKTKVLIKNIKGCFWVIDDGIGINKISQKQIFEDFYQSDRLICDKNDGMGLGLGIVNCSVKLIGGSINFKSLENGYTIFKVCL